MGCNLAIRCRNATARRRSDNESKIIHPLGNRNGRVHTRPGGNAQAVLCKFLYTCVSVSTSLPFASPHLDLELSSGPDFLLTTAGAQRGLHLHRWASNWVDWIRLDSTGEVKTLCRSRARLCRLHRQRWGSRRGGMRGPMRCCTCRLIRTLPLELRSQLGCPSSEPHGTRSPSLVITGFSVARLKCMLDLSFSMMGAPYTDIVDVLDRRLEIRTHLRWKSDGRM